MIDPVAVHPVYPYQTRFQEYVAKYATERLEIDREMFFYWLEVLPPVALGATVTLADGEIRRVSFLFAEGAMKPIAFWREAVGDYLTRYYSSPIDRLHV